MDNCDIDRVEFLKAISKVNSVETMRRENQPIFFSSKRRNWDFFPHIFLYFFPKEEIIPYTNRLADFLMKVYSQIFKKFPFFFAQRISQTN